MKAQRVNTQQTFLIDNGANILTAKFGKSSQQIIATGDDHNDVSLWSIVSSKAKVKLSGHATPVTALDFSSEEKKLYSGSECGRIFVWDVQKGKEIMQLRGHLSQVNSLNSQMSEEDNLLASGAKDNNVKIWDLKSGACVRTIKTCDAPITSVALSPDDEWVAATSERGDLRITSLLDGRQILVYQEESPILNLKFSPRTLTLAYSSANRTISYWELDTFKKVSQTKPDIHPFRHIFFDDRDIPTSQCVVYAAHREAVKIYDLEENIQLDSQFMGSLYSSPMDIGLSKLQNYLLILGQGEFNQFKLHSIKLDHLKNIDGVQSHHLPIQRSFSESYSNIEEKKDKVTSKHMGGVKNVKSKERAPAEDLKVEETKGPVGDKYRGPMQQSLIKSPESTPLNLDPHTFMKKESSQVSQNLTKINNIREAHESIMAMLKKRKGNLQVVSKYWTGNNQNAALNALKMMDDQAITQDVLSSILAEDGKLKRGLNYDNLSVILQQTTKLIESKYKIYVVSGLKIIQEVMREYGQPIIQIKTTPVMDQKDFSREERIKKVETCADLLRAIYELPALKKTLSRHDSETSENGRKVVELLEHFLKKCGDL